MKKENIKYLGIAAFVMYLAPSLITFAVCIISVGNMSFAHLFIIPALISAFAFIFGKLFPSSYNITEKPRSPVCARVYARYIAAFCLHIFRTA